jgi:hypothetical protein
MITDKATNEFGSSDGASSVVCITVLNDFDVLFGRGMTIRKQTGNNRFLALVADHRDEYRANNRHAYKDEIARRIMLTTMALGGRFLRKIDSTKDKMHYKINDDAQAWVVVDEETCVHKVKQALRETPWNAESPKARKRVKKGIDSISPLQAAISGKTNLFKKGRNYRSTDADDRVATTSNTTADRVDEVEEHPWCSNFDQTSAILHRQQQQLQPSSNTRAAGNNTTSTDNSIGKFTQDLITQQIHIEKRIRLLQQGSHQNVHDHVSTIRGVNNKRVELRLQQQQANTAPLTSGPEEQYSPMWARLQRTERIDNASIFRSLPSRESKEEIEFPANMRLPEYQSSSPSSIEG